MSVDLPLEHVYVAPDDDGDDSPAVRDVTPAIVLLHGRGADEQDLLGLARHFPDDLHVISLRAPDRLHGGYTWYDLDLSAGGLHRSQPDAEDFRRSLELISESIDATVDAYGIDPDRVGLLGFSQGAITSISLLLEDPDRYAWVVALHGYLAESHAELEPDGVAGKPVFVGAGTADEIIPGGRAERAAERLAALGADVTFETYDVGHGIGRVELEDAVAFVKSNLA